MTQRISLCMIVRDEEAYLGRCLASVEGVVDEIVVVDTGSKDRTVDVARQFGAIVREAPWRDDFAAARNQSLELATGDWVLYLDADEELDAGSRERLREVVSQTEHDGFYVELHNWLGSMKEREVEVAPGFRLFRNRKDYRFAGAVHEQILPIIQQVNPRASFDHSGIKVVHYGYLREHVEAKGKQHRNIRLLKANLAANPANAFLHFNLGCEYMLAHRFGPARQSLQKAMSLAGADEPWRPKLVKCYAAVLAETGSWAEALTVVKAEQERYPDFTDLVYMMGTAHQRLGDLPAAVSAFASCLALGPASGERYGAVDPDMGGGKAALALGQACEALGRDGEAVQAYVRAVSCRRDWAEPLQHLTCLLAKRVGAERTLRVLERLFPERSEADTLVMAGLLTHAGQHRAALDLLEPLAEADRLGEAGRYAYALCLAKLGRHAEALERISTLSGDLSGNPRVIALRLYCNWYLSGEAVPDLPGGDRNGLRELYAHVAELLAGDPPQVVARLVRKLPNGRLLAAMLKRVRTEVGSAAPG